VKRSRVCVGLSIDGGGIHQGGVQRARFRAGLAPRTRLRRGSPERGATSNQPGRFGSLSLYKCTRACIPFSHSLTRAAPSPTKFVPHSSIDYRPFLPPCSLLILQELFICQKLHLTIHPSSLITLVLPLAFPHFATHFLEFRKEAYNAAGCRWMMMIMMMMIIVLKFSPSSLPHHRCRCPGRSESPHFTESSSALELTDVERPHRARELTTTKSTSLPHPHYN